MKNMTIILKAVVEDDEVESIVAQAKTGFFDEAPDQMQELTVEIDGQVVVNIKKP